MVFEPFFWEHQPLRATASYQEEINQILRPSEADVVVLILWSRLGTRLPTTLVRPDGTVYSSGTEFEFEDAVNISAIGGVGPKKNGENELILPAGYILLPTKDGARHSAACLPADLGPDRTGYALSISLKILPV